MTFSPLIIWAKALFFFEQLFPVVARTWLVTKSDSLFLGPKFWFLAQKSNFCHTTPILVDDPFLALGMTVNFPPWKPFFDFPFRSYSCFRKKILLTAQKVFPLPTVGFYCTLKALALSARRQARFARRLDYDHSTFQSVHACVAPLEKMLCKFQAPRSISQATKLITLTRHYDGNGLSNHKRELSCAECRRWLPYLKQHQRWSWHRAINCLRC